MHGYRRRALLGAISPTDAVNSIFPTARIASGAGHNQSIWDQMLASAEAGQMVDVGGGVSYVPGTADCAAAQGVTTGGQNDMKLASTASGLALTGLQIASTAGVVAAPLTMGISIAVSSIIGLFSTIVNHHAQAVRKEQSVLCTVVPAANNYLQIIDQAVQSGLATPQDGIAALDSLVTGFRSQVGSIIQGSDPTSSGECNAACVMLSKLRAIVALKESEYQDLITTNPALPAGGAAAQTVTPARPNTTTPQGVAVPASSYASFYSPGSTVPTPAPSTSDWLPIAAMVVAGFFLMRSL